MKKYYWKFTSRNKTFGRTKKSISDISLLISPLRSIKSSGVVNRKAYAKISLKTECTLIETEYNLKPIFDVILMKNKLSKK
ncbi:MAG TPA: winged helix-turn-helix transcriptional regulator [Candidatus Coprocola pullicola]|nr:winged helix-turn-helix transcriptional regulator [Candidatus Coprocola pullicola]